MLLQRLETDADHIVNLPPPMYDVRPVKWIVDLGTDGSCVGIVSTTEADDARDQGKQRLVPYVRRTSGIRPILLADTPAYTFGIAQDDARAAAKHKAYVALVTACADVTGAVSVQAVTRFLTGSPVSLPDDMNPSDLITFRVDGEFPIDVPSVRAFWRETVQESESGSDVRVGECLVCGRRTRIPMTLPVPTKGIPQGQPSGTSLVSANYKVFESYGLERGSTCGVCAECGERFGKALNELLRSPGNHFRAGPVVFVFWTREEADFDPLRLIDKPDVEDVRLLLSSYYSGKPAGLSEEDEALFNTAALSASGGRVVVRDFDGSTVGTVKHNLARWFMLIDQVDPWGAKDRPLGLRQLIAAPFRDPEKQQPPRLPGILMKSALYGTRPLPPWLLSLITARCRATGGGNSHTPERVTHAQAALLKAVLASSIEGGEGYMAELDTSESSAAYLCGRLLAVLEEIQRAAIPGVNATVVDRFFAAASTAPASVFGKLLSDVQPHLAKLRKSSGAAHHALERRLEEVLASLNEFPTTLSMQEQALFSLGFYHQRAADRASRKAVKETAKSDSAHRKEQS
ncbi:MAG: type I-C CRISPR-associated protein Cas8c/Csd1 [Coriobacteriia bacterium]